MREAMLVVALLLAGCTGGSPMDGDAPTDDEHPAQEDSMTSGQAPQSEPLPGLLEVVVCDMPDRLVFAPAGPTDTIPSHCTFEDLDIPEDARSMRLNFSYTAAHATEDFGIRLADHDRCGAGGGNGCNIAEAFGPSPVILDVNAAALEGMDLQDATASAIGYGVDATFRLAIGFYSSDTPV